MTKTIALFISILYLSNPAFAQWTDPAEIDPDFPPAVMEVTDLKSAGSRLAGHVYLANGPGPHPTVLLLHGYPGNEKNLDLAQEIRRNGWNVAFFHYRGAWGSEGSFNFSNGIEDVAAMLGYLRDQSARFRIDPTRISLIGHSMGGFMALQGMANDKDVVCTIGIAAANLGPRAKALRDNPDAADGFKKYTDNLFMLRGFDGEIAARDLVEHADEFDLTTLGLKLSARNIFLIAGKRDQAVPLAVHQSLMAAYKKPLGDNLSEMVFDADHSYSWHRIALGREITGWLKANCQQASRQ